MVMICLHCLLFHFIFLKFCRFQLYASRLQNYATFSIMWPFIARNQHSFMIKSSVLIIGCDVAFLTELAERRTDFFYNVV